ncbi:MAG: DNA adenine methylase [Lachnospiraceae bacterium]
MRLTNYEFAEDIDKKEWLNSIKMYVGLPYFGGKSIIGRYILNNIFNLAVQMKKDNRKADIFIDAFTGGGKIGLSIPQGWFDTIVINDLNYGVYSYYKCCQDLDKYIALIYMIEKIGKEFMNRNFFHLAAYVRSFGLSVDMWEDKTQFVTKNEMIDPLVAAALTYWVTSASYNNMTAPDTTAYNITRELNDKEEKAFERANIERIIKVAYKRIPKLHEKLNNQQYVIENLDYKELIKKYNGLKYNDLKQKEQKAESMYINKNKLWYFDPPYHPYCLHGTDEAPYADTFTVEMADEMINILHGDKEQEYGQLEYFIKSDYDPSKIKEIEIKKGEPTLQEVKDLYKKLEESPFCKICVGSFDKGAVKSIGKKSVGTEFIWCRGFTEEYKDSEGEPAKED